MGSYNPLFRKLGDGYTYYKEYSQDAGGSDPYGEPTIIEVMADDQTFGGTDPTGAEIAVERETYEDVISQEVAPIQKLVIGERATFKITVVAGRLENLTMAAGRAIADIADIDSANLPDSNSGKGIIIGGELTLQNVAIVHKVCNSVSPNLSEYFYAPNCTAAENFGFKFEKNRVRYVELTYDVYPALQDDFIVASSCGSRHGLFQVIYEYA